MATYKAEFLSHYYEGRLRPIGAYAMGWIYWWARLAERAPWWRTLSCNALPAQLASAAGSPQSGACRASPPRPSSSGFAGAGRAEAPSRTAASSSGRIRSTTTSTRRRPWRRWRCWRRPAITSRAAHTPLLRPPALRLGHARRWPSSLLREILDAHASGTRRRHAHHGTRAELRLGLSRRAAEPVSRRPDAKRLQRPDVYAERIPAAEGERFHLPQLDRKAVVQGHCHHNASCASTTKRRHEEAGPRRRPSRFRLLRHGRRLRLRGEEHYDISMRLRRAVDPPRRPRGRRRHPGDRRRLQLPRADRPEHDRQALHLAQVLQMALREGADGAPGNRPEQRYIEPKPLIGAKGWKALGIAGALGAFAGLIALSRRWRRR